MALSREDNITKVGDVIAGTAVKHFSSEFSKAALQRTFLTSNLNPTGSAYQVILKEGQKSSIQLMIPIPADIWYLGYPPPELNTFDSTVTIRLRNYDSNQNNTFIGILKQPRDMSDVIHNDSPKAIFIMRYQTVRAGQSFDWDIGSVDKNCCGFLDFMVGPLGAMDALDICGEVSGSVDKIVEGGQILPPAAKYINTFVDKKTGKVVTFTEPNVNSLSGKELISIHIVTHGYVPGIRTELFVHPLNKETTSKIHTWIRVKLNKADTFPLPGEFLTLLARASVDFIWYAQDTSPFIVAGNWFHTASYTTGKITKIEGNNKYTVKVKGKEITGIKSSDYLEYFVDERVALMHNFPSKSKFAWKDTMLTSNLRILPITFYQK